MDKSFLTQYGNWVKGVLTGDMGKSYSMKVPVVQKLTACFWPTLKLTLVSLLIMIFICTHSDVSKDEAFEKAISMLEKMQLSDCESIMKSYPHQLSGGMRQRVGIAIAMTFNPELLLADEPTSALDVTTQTQIVRQMMELRDTYNTGIIIVTHNLGIAAYMSDQLIVMKHGKIVDQGTRDEVINHPASEYTKKLLKAIPEIGGESFCLKSWILA